MWLRMRPQVLRVWVCMFVLHHVWQLCGCMRVMQ